MPKCDFNKVAKATYLKFRHECSPVNLLHIFRAPFSKNISEGLLLSYKLFLFLLSDGTRVDDNQYFKKLRNRFRINCLPRRTDL